jgi:hypothetical protein
MQAFRRWVKGILLRDNDTTGIGDLSGTLTSADNGAVYIYQQKIKAFLSGAEVEVTTNSQTQTLTNKTIDADNNPISNLEVDNLKAGVLDTDLTSVSASDDTLASAKAIKTYVDNQIATVNEASEISYSNTTSGLTATDVQAAIDEVEGRLDTVEGGLPSGAIVGTTDAQTLTNKTFDADLNSISNIDNADIKAAAGIEMSKLEALTINRATETNGSGEIVASSVTSAELGHLSGVTSAIQTQIDGKQASDADLTALAALSGTGMLARTGAATYAERTIAGTTNEIDVANGDGVSGAPTIGISDDPVLPGTGSVTMPSGNTAARPGSPTNGMFRYNSETNEFEGYQAGAWGAVGGGSGEGNINHISNSQLEDDVSDYNTYADAAGEAPVDGTGGVANITFTHTTTASEVLRDSGSGKLAKDAVNRQGQGVSIDFTTSNADKYSIQRITFDYSTSANFADGDIRVYIYDVTNTTVIELTQRDLAAVANNGQYVGEFQATDSTSYRLIYHIASVNSTAYDVFIDNVQVGPRELARGPMVTDWIDFTPTGSFTNTIYTGKYRRVGNMAEIRYHLLLTGTPGASNLNLDLPSGLTMDTSILLDTTSFGVLGRGATYDNSAGFYNLAHAYYIDSNTISVINHKADLTYAYQAQTSTSAPYSFTTNDEVFMELKVPIEGWASNVTMSSDFGNRVIDLQARKNTGSQSSSGSFQTVGSWSTPDIDNTSSFNVSTGVFTCPEKGTYNVDAVLTLVASGSGSLRTIQIRKQGSSTIDKRGTIVSSNASLAASLIVHGDFDCEKGDTIEIQVYQDSGGSLNYTADSSYNHISIHKIQSPQTLAGGEKVIAKYLSDSGQSIPNSSSTRIDFEDKEIDTHNAVTTGGSWVFTAPIEGTYSLDVRIEYANSNNWTLGEVANLELYKNGSNYERIAFHGKDVTSGNFLMSVQGSTIVQLNKGETIHIQSYQASGAALSLSTATPILNVINIKKIN